MSKDMWIETPKLQTSVYIFDVENAKEVLNGGKAKLVEKGPYVYDEYHHKKNVIWNPNGTVSYENVREYHFNPRKSKGSLDDKLTIVNAPAGSISYTAKHQMSSFVRSLLSSLLDRIKEKLFVNVTVKEIIFDGYHDPLLSLLDNLKTILQNMNIPFPSNMNKVAIFYQRNMSSEFDGFFNLITGRLDNSNANQIYSWNFEEKMRYFPENCGIIKGNGELFRPDLPKSPVAMFSNDLCRPIIFQFDKESSVKGVWGNRYTIDDMFFANSTINKDNWCFEAPKSWANPKSTERLQFPSGVYNMGLCKFNSSTFISQPHFLGADPFYINQFVEGSLNPDEAKHQTSIVIEPKSGIPLEVIVRLQVNILIEPSNILELFEGFERSTFMPAFWFETRMTLPDDLKIQMWLLSNISYIMATVGSIGLIISVLASCCVCCACTGVDNLAENDDDTVPVKEEPKLAPYIWTPRPREVSATDSVGITSQISSISNLDETSSIQSGMSNNNDDFYEENDQEEDNAPLLPTIGENVVV